MLLVTGGFGFIGSHTVQALLGLGQGGVLTQHRRSPVPDSIQKEVGSRIFIEPVSVTDTQALLDLGKRYEISGIVHLGGPYERGPAGLFENIRSNMTGLANALQAASEWKVRRIIIPSTLAVYNGVSSLPWREDEPIPCTASFPIEALKKATEVFSSYYANSSGIECVVIRIAGIYGPGYDGEGGSLAARLVHAAVEGGQPDVHNILGSANAEDGADWCYVKDCGRAIALLATASDLHHHIYNVASGRATRNREVVEAIRRVIPDYKMELPAGMDPNGMGMAPYQDISRLCEDTGYEPLFTIQQGIADYIAWLQAGNPY